MSAPGEAEAAVMSAPGEAEAAVIRQGMRVEFETALDGLDVDREMAAYLFFAGASAFAQWTREQVSTMEAKLPPHIRKAANR